MITQRLKSKSNNQLGFTLIEVVIAITIAAIISGAIATAFLQTFMLNTHDSSHMTVVRQVQSAGHWLSQDAMMTQNVSLEDDPDSPERELVTFSRRDWADDIHQVVYSISDGELRRSYSGGDSEISVTIVAQYIDSEETSCEFLGNTLILTVTASIGGWQPASETRTYELVRRTQIWWS